MSVTPPVMYCANHPDIETSLRCNRCEKPICSKCAILTPTGYRCKECIHGQQKLFDTAQWYDYPLALTLVAILSFLGSMIVARLGFFTIILAPIAGVAISEVARLVIRQRRSKLLFRLVALASIAGCLPLILITLISLVMHLSNAGLSGVTAFFPLLWQSIYAFMVASTVYYRISGIKIS